MAYKTINWKDHVVEHPLRRSIKETESGLYIVKPEVGETIQKGTKQSAQNFNHMDEGILDSHIAAQIMLQSQLHASDSFNKKLDEYEASEATYEDIQDLVGEIWDAPYQPPRPEEASEEGIRGLFK